MFLLNLDHTITFWLYQQSSFTPEIQRVFYLAASVFVYLVPLVLLYLLYRGGRDRVNALKIGLTGLFAWQVLSSLTGYIFYHYYHFRDRPFAELGINELFLERPQKAFPSDHASLLLAVTLCFFAFRYPKLGWFFLIGGAVLSSLSRVAVGFHWFGDILGGWVIALLAFGIIRLFDRPLTQLLDKLFLKQKEGY